MALLKQGSRAVMGIGGLWGGVKYDRSVVVAPLHGILTKQMFVPPLWVVGGGGGPSKGRWRKEE